MTASIRELCTRYVQLQQQEADLRKQGRASEFEKELSRLCGEQHALVGRMGSCLPKSGPDAEWVEETLSGAHGEASMLCVANALVRQRRIPSRYLVGLVALMCRDAENWGRGLQRISESVGAIPVLDSMTRAAQAGVLSARGARLLTFYVRASAKEERSEKDAARERLKRALADGRER